MLSFVYEEQAGKKYLVYEKKPEDNLDILTMEMMRNNRVKGLAPFTCIQIDGRMQMKYDITGLISVKEYLSGTVNSQKLMHILESISDILMEAEEYLLDISSYVFDEDYVYVLPQKKQAVMIVLPISCKMQSADVFLKKLLLNIQYDQKEDCSYVAGLINILSGMEKFSVYGFKEQITRFKEQKVTESLREPEIPVSSFAREKEEKREKPEIFAADEITPPIVQEESKNEPEKKGILKKLFGKKEGKKEEKKEEKKIPFPGIQIPTDDSAKADGSDENDIKIPAVIPEQKIALNEQKVEKRDFGDTVFVDEGSAETFFIRESQEEINHRFFLRRCSTRENFEIFGKKVRIGRNPAAADICITGNRGIGRTHAVLYVRGENVYIADNDSKNKTFVCGTQIKPGEEPRQLKDGDKIQLGDEEFEFYIQ